MRLRFWEFLNGSPVKLALDEGQALTWSYFYPHEEGFVSGEIQWSRSAYPASGAVYREQWTSERDCDGPLERHIEQRATNLKFRESEGIEYPRWEGISYEQRDRYAEEMGY